MIIIAGTLGMIKKLTDQYRYLEMVLCKNLKKIVPIFTTGVLWRPHIVIDTVRMCLMTFD